MEGSYSVDSKDGSGTIFSFLNVSSSGDAKMSDDIRIQDNADGSTTVTLELNGEKLEAMSVLRNVSLRFSNYWASGNWNQIEVESVTFLYD